VVPLWVLCRFGMEGNLSWSGWFCVLSMGLVGFVVCGYFFCVFFFGVFCFLFDCFSWLVLVVCGLMVWLFSVGGLCW